jgi:hypothetical protein
VKMRDEGIVKNKAVYVALALDTECMQKGSTVLCITNQTGKYISQSGSRGVADIRCLKEGAHLMGPAL